MLEMGKRLLIFSLFLILLAPVSAQRSQILADTLHSEILGVDKSFTVYLPAGFDTSGEEYPVLYLLHGAFGKNTDWGKQGNMKRIADQVMSAGFALPMVVIMPDARGVNANGAGENMGYYGTPTWLYEKFFFEEFMPAVEKKYRIRSDKGSRAIAGLSMGGGGSISYAQHHPELFSSVCSLSGLVGEPSRLRSGADYVESFRESVVANAPQRFLETADKEQLAALKTVRWYLDCGDDDFLAEDNVRFFVTMKKLGIPLQFRMRDGGHSWEYWQSALPSVLQFVSVGFAR